MDGLLRFIVAIAVGLFIVAVIVPPALESIATANLDDVDAAVATMLTVLLPILAIVAISLAFMPKGVKSKAGL